MKVAFVDTLYFVALFNPRDQWHERAIAAGKLVAETKLITTEDVLVELLNFFSEYGEKARRGAVTQAEGILSGANIEVAPQSHEAFMAAGVSPVVNDRKCGCNDFFKSLLMARGYSQKVNDSRAIILALSELGRV